MRDIHINDIRSEIEDFYKVLLFYFKRFVLRTIVNIRRNSDIVITINSLSFVYRIKRAKEKKGDLN